MLIVLLVSPHFKKALAQDPGWTQITDTRSINCMADDDSLIWLGTNGGVVRFVKKSGAVSVINSANSGLVDNRVHSIAFEPNGNKWFGTELGLSKWDAEGWKTFDSRNSPLKSRIGGPLGISGLAIGAGGRVWVGLAPETKAYPGIGATPSVWVLSGTDWVSAAGSGVILMTANKKGDVLYADKYTPKGGTYYKLYRVMDGDAGGVQSTSFPELPGRTETIYSIAMGENGTAWVVSESGLRQWVDSTMTEISRPQHPAWPLGNIAVDSKDALWSVSVSGMMKFTGTQWDTVGFPTNLSSAEIASFPVDSLDFTWIKTSEGLYRMGGGEGKLYSVSPSKLPSNWITSLGKDPEGRIWIGTTNGICRYSDSGCAVWNSTNSIVPAGPTEAIGFDKKGRGWFVQNRQLARFDGQSWSLVAVPNPPGPNSINSLSIDRKGGKWLGTDRGLLGFDDSTWTYLQDSIRFTATAWDDEEDIFWLGSDGGGRLTWIEPSTWDRSDFISESASGWVQALAPGRNGVWIAVNLGTSPENPGQLFRYSDSFFAAFFPAGRRKVKYENLFEDSKGNLWTGVPYFDENVPLQGDSRPIDSALFRFQGGEWKEFNVRNSGLTNDFVTCMIEDSFGRIWFGTKNGLSIKDPEVVEPSVLRRSLGPGKVMVSGPFLGADQLLYRLDRGAKVKLEVLDLRGRVRAMLVNGFQGAGDHRVGFRHDSGLQILRLTVDGSVSYTKLMGM